jgi:hypothetical protein
LETDVPRNPAGESVREVLRLDFDRQLASQFGDPFDTAVQPPFTAILRSIAELRPPPLGWTAQDVRRRAVQLAAAALCAGAKLLIEKSGCGPPNRVTRVGAVGGARSTAPIVRIETNHLSGVAAPT